MNKKPATWLADALEESLYKAYMETCPGLVDKIRTLLSIGEPPDKIKAFCVKAAGDHPITADHVQYLIDYVNKQVKN